MIKPISHKKQLGPRWMDYHVMRPEECENINVAPNCSIRQIIHVAKQDGFWTSGQSLLGTGYLPGRKWGVFKSRKEAILYIIQENLPVVLKLLKKNEMWRQCLTPKEGREIRDGLIKLEQEILQPKLF